MRHGEAGTGALAIAWGVVLCGSCNCGLLQPQGSCNFLVSLWKTPSNPVGILLSADCAMGVRNCASRERGCAVETVLKTAGLTRRYRGRAVVDDLNLTVSKGDIYGFVGPNGAGKSTAMKMVCGDVLPTAGTVELFGVVQPAGMTSVRVGSVIEGPGLHPELSGFDNVMCRALALGVVHPKAAVAEALEVVGLSDVARKRAKAYSLGMKQRLGLALALVGGPDLLMLDEPFNGLDPQGVHDIRTLILRLNETRGTTVFISSHVLDQLARMVTRYGIIRQGRLVREMSAEEVEISSADRLCVSTPETPRALVVLQETFPRAKFTVMHDGDIYGDADISVNEVARTLVGHDVTITGLTVCRRDIEEVFLGLMGNSNAEGPVDQAVPASPARPSKGGEGRA